MSHSFITAYHEVQRHKLQQIEREGVRRGEKSDKDTDIIQRTNQFLDDHRPDELCHAGVKRTNAIYCYLADGEQVIDIASGHSMPPSQVISDADHALLRVRVPVSKCYVSDLDAFDAVKTCLEGDEEDQAAQSASVYWESVTSLQNYHDKSIKRPELLLLDDIPVCDITATLFHDTAIKDE